MKIVQIIPGSGGSFYCGNCLRDDKYYDTFKRLGHDVIKIPMYLPLFADEHDITNVPVFYGAVSLYLKQQFPIFRKFPSWFDRILNSKPMLKIAANQSGSTNAVGLEDMTISMLLGEDGNQSEELEVMVNWIEEHFKPDIIHISNALLLGIAHRLKEKLKVPVFCSLQDEDVWVDVMEPEFRQKIWNLMAEKAKDVDGFIAVSDYYANVSKEKMNIPGEKIHTIHLGVLPETYNYINASGKVRNIGYISRMCHSNGLDILVSAFIELKKNKEFDDVKLIITGGSTGADKKFIKQIHKQIKDANLSEQVEFQEKFDNHDRLLFFQKVSVVSVPVRLGEAFGIYLIEAMASGIPIVQPPLGAFPEIVNVSKGGLIYKENEPKYLAKELAELLSNKSKMSELSENARKSVEEKFNINLQAQKTGEIYSKHL